MADVQPDPGRPDEEVVDGESSSTTRRRPTVRRGRACRWSRSSTDLERVTAERDQFRDAYQRAAADFDNFRKQAQRRVDDEVARATGGVVERLLPVLDACDGALAHGATEVEPIVAALLGALEKEGLVRVDPIGEVFDPTVAEAVVHEPGDGGDHIVSEVMRAGLHVAGPRPPPRHGQGHRLADIRTSSAKGGVMAPQREWFEKDYYRVLGVAETASAKEIKSAYRKLSRQYHPDANEGDAAAEERFKEVSAAYDVVGNEERRKEYDEVRRLGPGGCRVPRRRWRPGRVPLPGRRRPRRPARRPVRPRRRGGGGRGGARARTAGRTSRPSSTSPSTTPSPGSPPPCTSRATRRATPATARAPSPAPARNAARSCGGQGVVSDNQGLFSFSSPCPACGGRGVTIDDPCPTCRGTGVERRPREVKVRIPAGVADGQRIRLKGRGGPGQNGGPPGDLYVDRARGAAPDVHAQGQRPHHHRADHVPRGRPRRRHRRAHPRRRRR